MCDLNAVSVAETEKPGSSSVGVVVLRSSTPDTAVAGSPSASWKLFHGSGELGRPKGSAKGFLSRASRVGASKSSKPSMSTVARLFTGRRDKDWLYLLRHADYYEERVIPVEFMGIGRELGGKEKGRRALIRLQPLTIGAFRGLRHAIAHEKDVY